MTEEEKIGEHVKMRSGKEKDNLKKEIGMGENGKNTRKKKRSSRAYENKMKEGKCQKNWKT